MKLLPVIKKLRAKFPDFKVRQLTDFYNRIYALIVLPECEYEMTLTFEYEYVVLSFGYLNSTYGYSQNDFEYMCREIGMLLSGECCVLSAFANGKYFASMLAYDHELSTDFYANEIKNFFMGTVNQGEIMLNYINSNKDKNYSFLGSRITEL